MCLNVISIVGDADDAADALREGTPASDRLSPQRAMVPRCRTSASRSASSVSWCRACSTSSSSSAPASSSIRSRRPSGHQILQVAAFDDISGELANYFADPPASPATGETPSAGELLLMGYAVTADVSVNPRYGRWDAATVSIVPLGQP